MMKLTHLLMVTYLGVNLARSKLHRSQTLLMDLFSVTKKSITLDQNRTKTIKLFVHHIGDGLNRKYCSLFFISCVTSLSCFHNGDVAFRALYFPFSLCVVCDLFESNMMGVKARRRLIRFFSSFLLGSGVGISRGVV